MLKRYHHKDLIEAGCDEAGRGCLAGPVFAAAVILPKNLQSDFRSFENFGSLGSLNDSKQLNEKQRNMLRPVIEKEAIAWAVAQVDHAEIDEINILNASFLAMHRAIDKLKKMPEVLLIDGNRFNTYKNIPHHCIVKGDGKYMSIAAASILAKTHRDEYMCRLHRKFPKYHRCNNKCYPTSKHRWAIGEFGITPYHRKSFTLTR